jgi:1-deoxy-D-xylulose-5-phosphate reductoisomerase
MNAANEEAVHAFIGERIALTDISRVIEDVMSQHQTRPATDLEAVLDADRSARAAAALIIESLSRAPVASSAA